MILRKHGAQLIQLYGGRRIGKVYRIILCINSRIDSEMNVVQGFNKFLTQVGPNLSNNIPNFKKHFTDYLNE